MNMYNGFKVPALAASITLAMSSTAALAATAPVATQLPGQGKVLKGAAPTVAIDTATNTMNVTLTASNIIDWGAGPTTADINSTGVAGFNIGADATVNFTGGGAVLNIDSTGNPSQIFGKLANAGNVFVANENGIIVGAGASITSASGAVGLLANTLDTTGFDGSLASVRHYNGTSTGSGDVTVLPGATVHGGTPTSTVLVTGAGTVNVDLGAVTGKIGLSAGLAAGGGAFAGTNTAANVNVTGAAGGSTVDSLSSAGAATTNGKLTVTASAVDGTLTNAGDLTLGATSGQVINQGKLTTSAAATFDSLINRGSYGATTSITIASGGNLTNTGSITGAGTVTVNDGNIDNSGTIAGVTTLTTQSDSADKGFVAGGQYFITNAGTITSDAGGSLTIDANTGRGVDPTKNDSTGSFTNTGTLQLDSGDDLNIVAQNNVSLGGTLQVGTGPAFKAVSLTNPLGGDVALQAGGYDSVADGFATAGALTVATPVVFAGGGTLAAYGSQVKLMDDVMGVVSGTDKTQAGRIDVVAGPALADDYAVRVASGKTVSASRIYVAGDADGDDHPNVILQGTVSGNNIQIGWSGVFNRAQAVSDVFSGPAGNIVGVDANPWIEFDFTGAVKTAKYLNDANNFRYNYLPIINKGTGVLQLALDPVAYATNGTSNGKSAVNVLVNGDVNLLVPYVDGSFLVGTNGTGTAVTGVSRVANTHLVLQSTGDIAAAAGYYWPGYVYLGTIDSNTDGSPAPGTLSADGTITLAGNFSNVLPGDVAGASGIHFMTGNALGAAAAPNNKITTNANALINFPTDLLTQGYAQGLLTTPTFFGGTAAGLVVTYGALGAELFNTHPVDATK